MQKMLGYLYNWRYKFSKRNIQNCQYYFCPIMAFGKLVIFFQMHQVEHPAYTPPGQQALPEDVWISGSLDCVFPWLALKSKIEKTPSVIQPNPQHCRIVLSPSYTFLSVLSSPVINASDNGFPLENCSPLATTVIMNWDWDYIQSQEGRFQCNVYKRRMEEAAKLKRWTEYREPVFQSKRHTT